MTIVRKSLRQLAQDAATDGQVAGWDNTNGIWKPVNAVRSITAGTSITIDATDPLHPIVNAGSSGDHGVKLKKSGTAQLIANATLTAVTWDTETWDTDGYHSTVSNTSRITIPTGQGGKYLICGHFFWGVGSAFDQIVTFYVNGTEELSARSRGSAANMGLESSTILSLAQGDYVEMWVYQASGTNRNTTATANACEFLAQRLV